jgi:serine/threonine protein kinase/tetratricopeptide (TPR) repeat protein
LALTAGTRLGSYQIVAPLGSGGMGEVYRARDAKLERDVAVKVLPQHLTADADALARFEREAKAVAALSHPNILAIFDFGTHDGHVYAVTELLEGETLRGKLDGGPISQSQAVNWAQQIARGLSAAHSKGVIHRDLKPENVFVTKDGHVKILDFGLAKKAEQVSEQTNAPTGSGHTAPGTVMGTVGYMSPEQVRGLPVDHRSDIFSFGAILYELLAGRKAFKKDTATDTIASIIRDEPPELSQSGRSIPVALDHIVRHCLEKDRDNRFGTANDVAFALSEASGATSVVTSGAQSVPGPPKRSGLWIAVAVVAVLAVAGLLLSKGRKASSSSAPGTKRVAVLPFENLGAAEDDYFADGIADQIRGKLTAVRGIAVIARGSSTPYKKTTKTPQEIAKELSANYLLTATVRWEKGGGQSRVQVNPELVEIVSDGPPQSKWQQPFDASLTDVFQVQSDIATKVAQALGTTLGAGEEKRLAERPTADLGAYDAFLKGESTSNGLAANDAATLRKAVAFYDQAVALDPSFAQAWARLAVECSLLYANTKPTAELAERARQASEKAVALGPGLPEPYLGLSYYERIVVRDARAAREACAKGLRLAPNDAALISAGAAAEQVAGNWEAALEHARDAARLDPRSAVAVRRLGIVLLQMRRYPEAHEVLDRALALTPASVFVNELKVMAFLGQGDLAGARSYFESAMKRAESTALLAFTAQNQDLVWVFDEKQTELLLRLTPESFDGDRGLWAICLAQACAFKGDSANLRVHAEEASKAFEEQLRQNADDAQRHAALGLALAYLGRKEEAIREGRRAVELSPVSKDAFNGFYVQHQLARTYILTGESEKALDQLEPLLKVPYYLSPGWLKIDPNFDPLRNNPRFQKLVAGAK